MKSMTVSSSESESGKDESNDETFDGVGDFGGSSRSRYHFRQSKSFKDECESPGGGVSSVKTILKLGSLSKTPTVGEVVRPCHGSKFEANKSFNRPSLYSGVDLDMGMLSKYCNFSDGYAVFRPSKDDRMWTPSHSGRHAIPDIYFECGFRLPMHPFFLFVF